MLPEFLPDPIDAPFIPPKDIPTIRTESLSIGGIGLSDISQGRNYQVWRLRVSEDSSSLLLSSATYPETSVISDVDIEECSLSFDQNMAPVYAWVSLGQAKYRWYDSRISGFTTTNLVGRSPYLIMDDNRAISNSISDVTLFYINAGNLCYRIQREFYETEHIIDETFPSGRIIVAGMQENFRVGCRVIPFG